MSRTALALVLVAALLLAPGVSAAPAVQPPAPVCDCSADLYNCADDFRTQQEAQACYDACLAQTGLDVHNLDHDGDGTVCESLPLAVQTVAPTPTATPEPSSVPTTPAPEPSALATVAVAAIAEPAASGGLSGEILAAIIGGAATVIAALLGVLIAHRLSRKP